MNLQEFETQLLALTPEEKTQVIYLLAQSLHNNWRGITKIQGVCGGEACISNTRIPVWVLVGYRHLGCSDGELLKVYPQLTASDLVNAWSYTEAYPEEINQAIAQNEDA